MNKQHLNIKKILVVWLAVAFSFSLQAALIKQDLVLVFDGGSTSNFGSISYNIADSVIDSGALLSTFDDVNVFEVTEFEISGGTSFDFFDFEAIIDSSNIFAGLEFLAFDVQQLDIGAGFFNGIFDVFSPQGISAPGFLDVFTEDGELFGFFDFTLGEVDITFNEVSEPQLFSLLLMLTFLFVNMRRKRMPYLS